MDRNAPADLRRRRRRRRARDGRADRALARPRPSRLRRDGALRADQLAASSSRWPGGSAAPIRRSTCRRTSPRTAPRCAGCTSCSRRRAATSTSTRAAGLLHARSVFAHGIWLDDADRAALAAAGAQIAHSPSSNLFLGSGLFGWRAAEAAGVHVSLASDVGGGTSLSMLRNMADAYKVQALAGERLTAWKALHAATRGAARRRSASTTRSARSSPAGSADVCVWDCGGRRRSATRRAEVARTLHERVVRLDDARRRTQPGRSVRRRRVCRDRRHDLALQPARMNPAACFVSSSSTSASRTRP